MIAEAVAAWPVRPEIVEGEAGKLAAFRRARAALAASGTVTLELALAQVPTVAAYRGADWEAAIARRLIKLPSVILPNLIVGRSVVPEFIQDDATPEALSRKLLAALATATERQAQLDGFAEVETIMRSAGRKPGRQRRRGRIGAGPAPAGIAGRARASARKVGCGFRKKADAENKEIDHRSECDIRTDDRGDASLQGGA